MIGDYKTALVTGASSGIGAACVTSLREQGLRTIALARREDRLATLAETTGCETLVLDLHDRDAIYDRLGDLEIDVLVNNAGLGRGFRGFLESDRTEIEEMIDINVTAAIHVVRAVAAGMAERKRGHVVNIGSVAGLYPIGFPVYGATKGAIHLFAQHLRVDLKGTGIRLTEICPGRIDTEFFETAFTNDEDREAFRSGFELLAPEDVAAAVLYAVAAPWRVNVSMIEMTPTEQAIGGAFITPVERG